MIRGDPILLKALCVGRAQPFRGGELSAFVKMPVDGPVAITRLGLAGDEQVETAHGGPDMAVHCYPQDHVAFWRERIGDHPLLHDAGAFGTNLALEGLHETVLHIGDRFRLGTALLQISQPRKPCWKIEHRFGHKGMVAAILESSRSGWYFRVIEQGVAQAGDALTLLQRGSAEWKVERVFDVLWGTGASTGRKDAGALSDLAGVSTLSTELREIARSRAGG
ncbi:MAG: MOSC domain-containing protein [Pontixanthobacter sp.]